MAGERWTRSLGFGPLTLARLMDEAEPDVLAFMTLHSDHRTSRAACKTLIDSERRKNTQASSDVGARQLARF